jgi:hypothetical protein
MLSMPRRFHIVPYSTPVEVVGRNRERGESNLLGHPLRSIRFVMERETAYGLCCTLKRSCLAGVDTWLIWLAVDSRPQPDRGKKLHCLRGCDGQRLASPHIAALPLATLIMCNQAHGRLPAMRPMPDAVAAWANRHFADPVAQQ